jgi:hypothetical protein
MTRTRQRLLLIGLAGSGLAVLLSGVAFMRPTVRANRLCRDAGFGPLPASADRVRMKHRGRVVGTPSTYLRFQATPADARLLFERSGIDPNNEPVPMRRLHFGPKSPSWMQWGDSVNGWIWHIDRRNASVWLAIDEDSGTVYIGVHPRRPAWLRRLLGR